jgi:hypothetical protein
MMESKIPKILNVLVISLTFTCVCFAQTGQPYAKHNALAGQTNSLNVQSDNNPYIIKNPSKGLVQIEAISGSDYLLNYVPNINATGLDTIVYEYRKNIGGNLLPFFGSLVYRISKVKALDDAYFVDNIQSTVALNVLDNDLSANTLTIKAIAAVSNGSATLSADQRQIIFNPNGFGYFSVQYIVTDSQQNTATATAHIYYTGGQPSIQDTVQISTYKNTPTDLGLPFSDFYTEFAPNSGSLALGTGTVQYLPNNNFIGTDIFVLAKTFQTGTVHKVVKVQVLDQQFKSMLVDDKYATRQDATTALYMNVFQNDILQRYRIQSYTTTNNGTLRFVGNDAFTYIPNPGFRGVDQFTYTVCSPTICETAKVFINVDNLQPELSDYYLVTTKNQPIIINYALPIANYNFTVTKNPTSGQALYYPGFNSLFYYGQWISGYNLLVYNPRADYAGNDRFEVKYCVGQDCKTVKIDVQVLDIQLTNPCVNNCVWEGDANNDGKVNMTDLLTLGSHFAETGPSRTISTDGLWLGRSAASWAYTQTSSSTNLKYADCNGDGIISHLDTSSISQYYNKNHTLTNNPIGIPTNFPIYLIPRFSNLNIGDLAVIDIVVGTEGYPAFDLSGFALSLDYNPAVLDSSSVCMMFDGNSWLIPNNKKLSLSKAPWGGRIDGAVTRIDKQSTGGIGKIGVLLGIVDDQVGGIGSTQQFSTKIKLLGSQSSAMDGLGNTFQLKDAVADLHISRNKSFDQNQLLIFPNPATEGVQVHLNGLENLIGNIVVYSSTGQKIKEVSGLSQKSYHLGLDELQTGLYIVQVKSTTGQLYNQKLKVVRP